MNSINTKYNIGDTVYFADKTDTHSVVELKILSIIVDNDGIMYGVPGNYLHTHRKEQELYATYEEAQDALDDEKLLTMRLTELKEVLTDKSVTAAAHKQLNLFSDIHRLATKLNKGIEITVL